MEILIIIAVILFGIINVGLYFMAYRGVKNLTQSTIPAPKSITRPAPEEHKLVKTWIKMNSMDTLDGWRAKCSCGTVVSADGLKPATYTSGGSLGSESSAIEKFEKHAKNYRRANGNPYKDEYDKLKAEFDEYKKSCYCKDVSSVALVPLKG